METLFLLLFWVICTLGIGYSILRLLFCRNWPFFFGESLALSYGAGLAIVSLQMAVISLLGIKFSIHSVLIWFLPVFLAVFFLNFKAMKSLGIKTASWGIKNFSFLEKFFIVAMSFEVIYALFRTLVRPMESYDAVAIYALKAKIFYLEKAIPHNFFKDFAYFVPHIEYPLLIPMAETYLYIFLGSLNDIIVKIIFPLYYIALLTIFYFVSRTFLNRKESFFFTFLLATIPQITDFATNGYADIPFAFYCSASFFYLYRWLKENENTILVLSLIFSIFAIWTKAEGLMFALINAATIVICMAKERQVHAAGVIYAAVSLLAVIAYILAWRAMGLAINSDFTDTQVSVISKIITGFKRIPSILYEYQIQFFGPKKWNIIWILFLTGFILGFKKIFTKELMPVTVAIMLVFLGYTAIYMFSSPPQGIGWHLSTSGSRLFIHFLPITVFWLALLFKELKLGI